MLGKYQNIILIVVVLIIAFVVYSYFFTGKEEAPLMAEEVAAESAQDQDLITLLIELKGITLDESIFSDPTFQSLQDFSQELIPEPTGRPNPFAPLNARAE